MQLDFSRDGVDFTSSFTSSGGVGTGCTFSRGYSANLVLPETNEGVHALEASMEDVNGFLAWKKVTYTAMSGLRPFRGLWP